MREWEKKGNLREWEKKGNLREWEKKREIESVGNKRVCKIWEGKLEFFKFGPFLTLFKCQVFYDGKKIRKSPQILLFKLILNTF